MLARRVQAAGPSAVGFFYYSGHGASDGSTNYLILVDVKTTETGELWDQSLRLTEIMRKLKAEAGNGTHFVVFDACRNTLKLRQPGSRAVVPWLKRTACSSRTRRPRVSSPPTWAPTLAPMPKCLPTSRRSSCSARCNDACVRQSARNPIFNALRDVYFAGAGAPQSPDTF